MLPNSFFDTAHKSSRALRALASCPPVKSDFFVGTNFGRARLTAGLPKGTEGTSPGRFVS